MIAQGQCATLQYRLAISVGTLGSNTLALWAPAC